jgi:hypothetical protein
VSTINPTFGRLLAGLGGAVLIASLFMPWSDSAGVTHNGWQTLSAWDVFLAITGVCGIAAAITGGRFGFFRPDLSFNGMTDIFGVIAGILIAWLILFDFPSGANQEVGLYLALVGAAAVATGAGDFRVRSLFPRMPSAERSVVEPISRPAA